MLPEDDLENEKARIVDLGEDPGIPLVFVAGGKERQNSVENGLACVPLTVSRVLVHDAARPFASSELFWRVNSALDAGWGGAIPGIPLSDSIKLVDGDTVRCNLPRESLVAVQTPQAFFAAALRKAHQMAKSSLATDDASLLEECGLPVKLVPGEEGNIKITRPRDLELLKPERHHHIPCNGFGYDVHRFGGDRPLRIGGIEIPSPIGLLAHSDGDVLLHALMDAILGCAGLGDIGGLFPDSDPAYSGISSSILLDQVLGLASQAGVRICHVDLVLVAQKPRFGPFAREIASNVARLLQISPHHVNFKATTEEHMGFTGRVEGIKAYAMVSALCEAQSSS